MDHSTKHFYRLQNAVSRFGSFGSVCAIGWAASARECGFAVESETARTGTRLCVEQMNNGAVHETCQQIWTAVALSFRTLVAAARRCRRRAGGRARAACSNAELCIAAVARSVIQSAGRLGERWARGGGGGEGEGEGAGGGGAAATHARRRGEEFNARLH